MEGNQEVRKLLERERSKDYGIKKEEEKLEEGKKAKTRINGDTGGGKEQWKKLERK